MPLAVKDWAPLSFPFSHGRHVVGSPLAVCECELGAE